MKITNHNVTVRDLAKNYSDDGDDGVYAFDNQLIVRPNYQRAFVYNDKQRNAVIDSVVHGYPLGLIYWAKRPDGKDEVLDGQQRIISICSYIHDDYSINHRFWHNLDQDEKDQILNYQLDVRVCDGTNQEKLAYFKRINVPGAVLTHQELLNATYTGPFLEDAKEHFSKRNCVALNLADGYISGNPIRQDILQQVLVWIADRDNLESEADYMAAHQNDDDANDLWQYFQKVIAWAKMLFPKARKKITNKQDWGMLYNQYQNNTYNSNDLENDMKTLILNDDIKRKAGIIPYLLSDRTKLDQKYLNLRQFTKAQILKQYQLQQGKCAICHKAFDLDDMEADHINAFSLGADGWSSSNNLQMLCRSCNRQKSNKTATLDVPIAKEGV